MIIMKIRQLLLASVSVFNIVGCANNTISATPVESPSAVSVISPVAAKLSSSSSPGKPFGFADLKGVVRSTKNAIEDGKLDDAKTEFAKFEAAWQPVEDGVRSKSADNYQAVEEAAKSVESELANKQDKRALLTSLQKLNQIIDKISKK
jgi:ribosomal protein S20